MFPGDDFEESHYNSSTSLSSSPFQPLEETLARNLRGNAIWAFIVFKEAGFEFRRQS